MSVSTVDHLPQLDQLLYDRPAGRNIVDHAMETITALRIERAELQERLHQQTRAAFEAGLQARRGWDATGTRQRGWVFLPFLPSDEVADAYACYLAATRTAHD